MQSRESPDFRSPEVGTGFVSFFGLKIQGLLKDFQGHIFHFSRTPCTAKSKDAQLLIVAIVPT